MCSRSPSDFAWPLWLGLGCLAIAGPAASQDDAKTKQLRLLCAQLSGDLTDPGGMAAFQRCLTTHNPTEEIRRDNNVGSASAKAGASCSNCPDHDPNKPVALGAGVNKGNIDNKSAGPQYFYFSAGPGHVEVHYAFHEMGMFGNPYKQVLNFDILGDDHQNLSHDAIESMGNLAKFTRPGDLTKPMNLVIRVTSPDAPIRLGGYFEIEALGAVRFAGKAIGGNVKPEDTSLAHPERH